MKKDIHPEYKKLKITIGKDEFITASTLKSGEILMDIDFRKHPAWNKGAVNMVNQSNKNVSDFNKKFGGMSFGMKK
ncbi:50S ribosomal protein L31 [Rickettsiaceae bacterium]|nr:50S ribosomal protein L31 [Rickettsiaceae bacterium]